MLCLRSTNRQRVVAARYSVLRECWCDTEAQGGPLTRHGNAACMPSCRRGVCHCSIDLPHLLLVVFCPRSFLLVWRLGKEAGLRGGWASLQRRDELEVNQLWRYASVSLEGIELVCLCRCVADGDLTAACCFHFA